MLALNGKPDIAEWQSNDIFQRRNAFVIQPHQRVYGHTPAVTLARLAPGHTQFQAAGNGFENAAREIAQMWGEDNVSTEVRSWLMAMGKDAIRLQANFTKLFEIAAYVLHRSRRWWR